MHLLFVDESGTPPPPDKVRPNSYFVLGGIVVPEDQWTKLAEDLKQIRKAFSIVGEIKWRYFATPKEGSKPNPLSHLTPAQRENVRIQLYRAVTKYKSIKLICVVVNLEEEYRRAYVRDA